MENQNQFGFFHVKNTSLQTHGSFFGTLGIEHDEAEFIKTLGNLANKPQKVQSCS